jgi:hypothetical protein
MRQQDRRGVGVDQMHVSQLAQVPKRDAGPLQLLNERLRHGEGSAHGILPLTVVLGDRRSIELGERPVRPRADAVPFSLLDFRPGVLRRRTA